MHTERAHQHRLEIGHIRREGDYMIYEAKMHISTAYNQLLSMTVAHDNVKRVAIAEQELEEAFRVLEELEKNAMTENKEDTDGQTD